MKNLLFITILLTLGCKETEKISRFKHAGEITKVYAVPGPLKFQLNNIPLESRMNTIEFCDSAIYYIDTLGNRYRLDTKPKGNPDIKKL